MPLLYSMNFPSKENIFLLHYPFDLFSHLKLLEKKEHAFKAIWKYDFQALAVYSISMVGVAAEKGDTLATDFFPLWVKRGGPWGHEASGNVWISLKRLFPSRCGGWDVKTCIFITKESLHLHLTEQIRMKMEVRNWVYTLKIWLLKNA